MRWRGRDSLAGARRGRGDNCRARGVINGFPAARSTPTLVGTYENNVAFAIAACGVLGLDLASRHCGNLELPEDRSFRRSAG